jgi:hypothetical protein
MTINRQTYKLPTVVFGGQSPVNLDYYKIPFQTSVLIDLVSGTANFGVEYTTDNIEGVYDPSGTRWLPSAGIPYGTAATTQYTFNFPVTGVRLNIQSMTGELRMATIQGIGV